VAISIAFVVVVLLNPFGLIEDVELLIGGQLAELLAVPFLRNALHFGCWCHIVLFDESNVQPFTHTCNFLDRNLQKKAAPPCKDAAQNQIPDETKRFTCPLWT